ncbi:unnamed protein product [Cylicostephanus goldi]|uniref:Uncharacterized protein n=1 Tax=Cylicostephanus goldi TaxID=71465 RepID=A0A3P6SLZ9_CYLGO|nr:unnamed protein product [Cylicostephanus goldi]
MDDIVIDAHDSDTGSSSSKAWIKNTSNFPSSVLSLVTLAILGK